MFRKVDDFLGAWKYLSEGTGKFMDTLTDESITQSINSDHRTLGRIAFHVTQTIGEMMEQTGLKLEGPGKDDPLPKTAAEIRKLREALKAVIPPARGLFGGPLIGCKAIYEDGTNEDTKRHRGWIDHADYRRARAALADGEKE